MTCAGDILKTIIDKKIAGIDFRFTDICGTWHHLTYAASHVNSDILHEGVLFDGSSIPGWKKIHESDMTAKPDLSRAILDPFTALPSLILFCDILEPTNQTAYECDPRAVARRAEAYLAASGIGDIAYFGAEAEFFVFDDIRFQTHPYHNFFAIDSEELPANSGRSYDEGNIGHRPRSRSAYFPTPPIDGGADLRAEMLQMMAEMGLSVEKHHHEVAPAQHELNYGYSSLLTAADNLQIYKYVVRVVAHSYGKSATFMPKPIEGDNASGLHVHQSIFKGDQPVFAGNSYSGLSEICLYYIGGIIRHARAINAFTNPTTNSYKRLVPGFEAPTILAYSARNRSASCRIPFVNHAQAKRIEARFPDPSANSYLAFSAMLMAGLDGIANSIHPGDPLDKDLYNLSPEDAQSLPHISSSLSQSLSALEEDNDFLLKGNVFTYKLIESFIDLKREEVRRLESAPSPIEFDLYYSR